MHVDPINPKTATMTVKFSMEDPESLTGRSEHEVTVPANPRLSMLEVALGNGINIEHACGGVCACSTCHVYIEQGEECLSGAVEAEEDRVEEAPGLQRNSRLSCQCVIEKKGTIVVRIPSWNRNAVKEVPH
ncbi:MAG: 2Fe-2S iron-sulfur cluster-binding protein [Phycisphaerales bacterium]